MIWFPLLRLLLDLFPVFANQSLSLCSSRLQSNFLCFIISSIDFFGGRLQSRESGQSTQPVSFNWAQTRRRNCVLAPRSFQFTSSFTTGARLTLFHTDRVCKNFPLHFIRCTIKSWLKSYRVLIAVSKITLSFFCWWLPIVESTVVHSSDPSH